MKTTIHTLLLALLFSACSNGDPYADCPLGHPTPIFADSLEQVVKHKFGIDKNLGVEYVQFDNGVYLEVYQSGCELVAQEFRFRLPGKSPRDDRAFWIDQAIAQMRFMGSQSSLHLAFAGWADALERDARNIQLGEEYNLEGNIFIKVDRISSSDHSILILALFQKDKYK